MKKSFLNWNDVIGRWLERAGWTSLFFAVMVPISVLAESVAAASRML